MPAPWTCCYGVSIIPLLANIFMVAFEVEVIKSNPMNPKWWHRYVDDVFAIWPHGKAALKNFLGHLNSRHPNITFSKEMERDRTTTLSGRQGQPTPGQLTRVRRLQESHQHRYQQAASHHPPAHNRTVTTTLLDRANAICDKASRAPELYVWI
jgi:hypothetical protein